MCHVPISEPNKECTTLIGQIINICPSIEMLAEFAQYNLLTESGGGVIF